MRRALRAPGERVSPTESVAMEGRSSGRSPLSVRVLTASVVGFFTSSVVKYLLKASLSLAAVLKLASALKFKAKSSLGGYSRVKEAGPILKSDVPSCRRGAGKNARVTASRSLTAVLKLAAALNFHAESSLVATAAREVGATLKSRLPSCGRGAGEKNRAQRLRAKLVPRWENPLFSI